MNNVVIAKVIDQHKVMHPSGYDYIHRGCCSICRCPVEWSSKGRDDECPNCKAWLDWSKK